MPSHCFINSVFSSGVIGKLIKSYHRLVNQSTVTNITYYEHVPIQFLLGNEEGGSLQWILLSPNKGGIYSVSSIAGFVFLSFLVLFLVWCISVVDTSSWYMIELVTDKQIIISIHPHISLSFPSFYFYVFMHCFVHLSICKCTFY